MLWRIYLFVCKSDKSHSIYAPPLIGGALSDDALWRLTSVCFSVWCLSVCRLSVAYMERRPGDHDLWPFDLERGVRVMCDVRFPRPLCFWLWHDVRDRQTDRRRPVHADSAVVKKMDPLHFLAVYRKNRLNSVLFLSLGFLWLYVMLLTRDSF